MRRLLARLQQLRHRLSVSRSIHGSTSKHQQEAHDPLQGQQPRRFRKAPPSAGRQRRQQPRPPEDQRRRKEARLPALGKKTYTGGTRSTPQTNGRNALVSNTMLITLGVLQLITLHFISSIPPLPPLPQPHDCSAPQA